MSHNHAVEWVTNDDEAAEMLRKADAAYARGLKRADALPLAEKVEAIRSLRLDRAAAYRRACAISQAV